MIPESAVEAAAQGLYSLAQPGSSRELRWDGMIPGWQRMFLIEARAALVAAAQHMLAPVYEEGWLASRDFYLRLEGPVGGLDANPYRPAK